MTRSQKSPCLIVPTALPLSLAHAAPVEGETFSNIAALLVLLGIGALLMGLRNLREMRHKRLDQAHRGLNRHIKDPAD
jgi:hypothetical protein